MIEVDRLIFVGIILSEDVVDRVIRFKLLEEYVG